MRVRADSLVSICIPAWERPVLIRETVESCLIQTYRDIEVVIADDSRTDRVERALAAYFLDPRVRYSRNPERLGQAGNVNQLFDLARGDRLMILHDDDLLVPDAIETLAAEWQRHPQLIACYGKRYMIADDGEVLPRWTHTDNHGHHRHGKNAGVQRDKLWSALVQQVPSDGYMMRTAAARATRFRPHHEVGDACDYDFNVRLAYQTGEFSFVDRVVSSYRLSAVSVSTTSQPVERFLKVFEALEVPTHLGALKAHALKGQVQLMAHNYVRRGQRRRALRLMLRPGYLRFNFSAAGLKTLVFFLPRPLYQPIVRVHRWVREGARRVSRLLVLGVFNPRRP